MKKHQHFIPRSYLKNFAVETESGKIMLEAKYRMDEGPKDRLLSIADICVSKNIYTIPNIEATKKYALEDYYAKEVDEVYPEVYNWLTDTALKKITAEQKVKILMTIISMYFRTPRFLRFHEKQFDNILQRAQTTLMDQNGWIKFNFKGKLYNFHLDDIERIRQEHQIENKAKFLHSHLEAWHEFTRMKLTANIAVAKIYDDTELITSDNPITIRRIQGRFQSIFDPENMIEVPLDSKHYLTIYPNSESVGPSDSLGRSSWDKLHAIKVNYNTDKFSMDWLLGKPNSIHKHLLDQQQYGAHSPENYKILAEKLGMQKDMEEILSLVQLGINQDFASKVKEIRTKDVWRGTPQLQELIELCSQHGLSTE